MVRASRYTPLEGIEASSVQSLSFPVMIDVLLVDDYPMMRQLLRDILEHYPDIRIVGEAQTGEDAIALTAKLKPIAVIIDINLPTITGMETTKLIRRQSPGTTIIGLTAGSAPSTETEMRHAGAKIVLNKDNLVDALYPTIVEALTNTLTSPGTLTTSQ